MMKQVHLAVLCLILAACAPSPERFTATAFLEPTQTRTAAPTVTPTIVPLTTTDCFWNWNRRPLPELSEQVQAALDAAGIAGASTSAVAYGEDCIDPQTNTVQYFATMETDFFVTLQVEDLANLDALSELAAEVLAVLDGFPPNSTPGPQPGYIGITFVAGEEECNLWFTVEQAADARSRGLSGAALLEALGYRP